MARKDITMTDAEVEAYLAEGAKTLIVTTLGNDGHPHTAPMWYAMDDGLVVFRSFTKSQKIVNLHRDDRITVLVETGASYGELRGVMIRGRARLDDDPAVVLDLYGRLAARYPMVGDTPMDLDTDALEAAFGRFASKNTAVRVIPERFTTWDHTKLGGAY